jgi:hypothetical protein
MTPRWCAPANQMTPAQAVELCHETRLSTEPALVFLNHVGARAILADHERIAPHARPADVGRIRHRPFELLLVEHLRRLTLLHCQSLSLDAARPERGVSAAKGCDAGGGSPGLAGRERSEQPKAGDTHVAGEALAPQCRGALQGSRCSMLGAANGKGRGAEQGMRRNQEASARVLCGSKGNARRRWWVRPGRSQCARAACAHEAWCRAPMRADPAQHAGRREAARC